MGDRLSAVDASETVRLHRFFSHSSASSLSRILNVALLGGGLLGGSLALDLKNTNPTTRVTLWARREATLLAAREQGIGDHHHTDIGIAVKDADLVIVCTPAETVAPLIRDAADKLAPGTIITDVASVKASVVLEVGKVLPQGCHFIGSHPMAGSHESGILASRLGLYQGATCLITPLADDQPQAIEKVRGLWKSVGCRVVLISPEDHDRMVAQMSHLPHAIAASLVNFVCSQPGDPSTLCGNGFRDTTRIAAGPPQMWTDIMMLNRQNILQAIDGLVEKLNDLAHCLQNQDSSGLYRYLETAQQSRNRLHE